MLCTFFSIYDIILLVIIMSKSQSKSIRSVNRFVGWLLHMVGYALILICMSVLFPKSFYINNDYFGLYGLLVAVIMFWINQTIKPIIVLFTLPITGVTLGIFYPFINLLMLYLVSFLLGSNFVIHGLWIPLLISILISVMNIILDHLIFKPVLERGKK